MSPLPELADAMEASAREELFSALLVEIHETPELFPFESQRSLREHLIRCGLHSDFGCIVGWNLTIELLEDVARTLRAVSLSEDLC